jgi:hypothetical protein
MQRRVAEASRRTVAVQPSAATTDPAQKRGSEKGEISVAINTKSVKPALIEAEGGTLLTPEQIVEQLRILRLHVPEFGPLAVAESLPLHAAANVPNDLVVAAIHTIGASAAVEGVIGQAPDALLADQEEVARWSAVDAELRTLLSGVGAAILTRRYRLGLTALQTYNITRQLVRQKEHANLLPHFDAMRRLNRFGHRRRPAAPAPAAPKQ